jgi:hypothetical protein
MAKRKESDNIKTTPVTIIGYLIPDVAEAATGERLSVSPVFASEKSLYKKSLIFATIDLAKAEILKRYGREQ